MSYCVVILRTPPYWSVRVASGNFKLGEQFNSLLITHSKRYDINSSSMSQKISTWKNLVREAAEEQNGPGSWELAGESGSDSTKTAY